MASEEDLSSTPKLSTPGSSSQSSPHPSSPEIVVATARHVSPSAPSPKRPVPSEMTGSPPPKAARTVSSQEVARLSSPEMVSPASSSSEPTQPPASAAMVRSFQKKTTPSSAPNPGPWATSAAVPFASLPPETTKAIHMRTLAEADPDNEAQTRRADEQTQAFKTYHEARAALAPEGSWLHSEDLSSSSIPPENRVSDLEFQALQGLREREGWPDDRFNKALQALQKERKDKLAALAVQAERERWSVERHARAVVELDGKREEGA